MKSILKTVLFSFSTVCLLMPLSSNAIESLEKCVASRIIGSFVDIEFNPHRMQTRTHSHVQMESSAQLYRRGRDGSIINELAKTTDINLENKFVRITLDPTCHWSDGQPITANDVVAGINRSIKQNPYNVSTIKPINDGNKNTKDLWLRVIDNATIEFNLITFPQLLIKTLSQSNFTPVPLHLGESWPGSNMVRVSSGPFVAVSHTDTRMEFERNPHYCDGLESNTKKIIHHGIDGKRTIGRMMESNLVNIGEQISTGELNDLQSSDSFDEKYTIWSTPPQVMSYLAVKPTSVIGQDPELTKAILLAIDFEKLADFHGTNGIHGRHMQSLSFSYEGYDPLVIKGRLDLPYEERLEKARQILTSKGYGANNKLKISFSVRHSTPYEPLGFMIRGMLNSIYINAKTEVVKQFRKRITYDLSLNAVGTTLDHPNNILSHFFTTLSILGDNRLEKRLNNLLVPMSDEQYYIELQKIEQELLDTNIFHPVYEVLSPTVLAKNVRPGKEFYFLGRNMIFDDCL